MSSVCCITKKETKEIIVYTCNELYHCIGLDKDSVLAYVKGFFEEHPLDLPGEKEVIKELEDDKEYYYSLFQFRTTYCSLEWMVPIADFIVNACV